MPHSEVEKEFNKIINKFTAEEIFRLNERFSVVETDEYTIEKLPLLKDNFDILSDISDAIWDDAGTSLDNKIELGMVFFERYPSYFHGLVPFYHLIKKVNLSESRMHLIWNKFSEWMMSKRYKNEVEYVLWVEFFEDSDTVEASWFGMLNACRKNMLEHLLLPISGPVPWGLKFSFYKEMLANPVHHFLLLKALLFSMVDVYGKYDLNEVKLLADQLIIDRKSDEFLYFVETYNRLSMKS